MAVMRLYDRRLTPATRITIILVIAVAAFWLGNTVLNSAALIFMGFVLGWKWTGLRLALGIPLVFGTGYLVSRLARASEVAGMKIDTDS